MPKVSIIVPIYNVKEYMSAAVTSVINQSEKDIEIILVDDGSTDGSGRLCDQFAESDPRIQVIHKKNGGLSSARNAGVISAHANYVLFLDGDDYIHPRTVERLLEAISIAPADIVQFQYQEVEETVNLPDLAQIEIIGQSHTAQEAFSRLYEYGGVYASGCTKLIRKQLLIEIPFENIRHEDEMWCTRVFQRDLTITYIPDILYGYIMRQGSIIHSQFRPSMLDILEVRKQRIEALNKLGLEGLESQEIGKLFFSLLTLYRAAEYAHDDMSKAKIIHCFLEYKHLIMHKASIQGKLKLFLLVARIRNTFPFYLYCLVGKVQRWRKPK